MNIFGTATILGAISLVSALSSAASAMPVAGSHEINFGGEARAAYVAFVPEQEHFFGRPLRLDRFDIETARSASESYFDFDAIITLGTMAMAGGALAAVGFASARRRGVERDSQRRESSANWRETVMQAVEADLARYTRAFRRAA